MPKIWLLSFVVFIGFTHARAGVGDSLKSLLDKPGINDSMACALMNDISYEFLDDDINQALFYAQKAYEKATKLRHSFLTMRSLGQMGNAYMQQRKNLLAIECFIKASKYAEKMKDSARISAVNHNICILYHRISKTALARKYLTVSLRFAPSNTPVEELASSKILLGSLFYDEKNYPDALRIFQETAKMYEKSDSPNRAGHAYMNIAIVKVEMGQLEEATKNFIQAHERFVLLKEKGRAGQALFRLADTYLRMKKYDKAFAYHDQAMRYFNYQLNAGNDFDLKVYLEKMGKAFIVSGNVAKANEVLSSALSLYHKSLENLDSIVSSEREQAFADMAVKYDTEMTEKANKILSLENKQKENEKKQLRMYTWFGIAGALLMACLGFLFWRSSYLSKKANKKIEAQKSQIERQRDEIQAKNHEITSSIEYAKSLQAAILPFDHNIKQHLKESFVLWLPRDIVSGDFYWFHEKDGYVYYAVADCTGHGVPGAFVSMTCHNILNQVVIDKGITDPGEVLTHVNNQVCQVFKYDESGIKAQDGMDVVFCRIDKKNLTIEFAGALNPLVLIRKGVATEYKTDKYPIGGRTPEGHAFTTHKITCESEDWIYLFSDGYKDQFGGVKGKKIRSKNFIDLLGVCSRISANEQKQHLIEFLHLWQGSFERVDDILVVGFRLR